MHDSRVDPSSNQRNFGSNGFSRKSSKFYYSYQRKATSIHNKISHDVCRLHDKITPMERYIFWFIWVTIAACYIAFNNMVMSEYDLVSDLPAITNSVKETTTYSTAQTFWDAKSYVIFVLYLNGCYILPFLHLGNLAIIMVWPLTPKRKRMKLDRIRFLAKFAILPVFLLLFMIFSVDTKTTGVYPASLYVKPREGSYVQMFAGFALLTFENWVVKLNDCDGPDMQNKYFTRVAGYASGCSLICMMAFLLSHCFEVELFGLLRFIDPDGNPKREFNLVTEISDIISYDGIEGFAKIILPFYFGVTLLGIPFLIVIVECVWRVLAGEVADEADPDIKPFLPTLDWIRTNLRVYYFYDIFLITLLFMTLELEEISGQISKGLNTPICQLILPQKCFDLRPKLLKPWGWLLAHVIFYYISVYSLSLYQRITFKWWDWNKIDPFADRTGSVHPIISDFAQAAQGNPNDPYTRSIITDQFMPSTKPYDFSQDSQSALLEEEDPDTLLPRGIVGEGEPGNNTQ